MRMVPPLVRVLDYGYGFHSRTAVLECGHDRVVGKAARNDWLLCYLCPKIEKAKPPAPPPPSSEVRTLPPLEVWPEPGDPDFGPFLTRRARRFEAERRQREIWNATGIKPPLEIEPEPDPVVEDVLGDIRLHFGPNVLRIHPEPVRILLSLPVDEEEPIAETGISRKLARYIVGPIETSKGK